MTVGREVSIGGFRPEMWSRPQRVRSDPEEIQSSPFGSFSVRRLRKREAPESQGVLVLYKLREKTAFSFGLFNSKDSAFR